MNAKVKLCYLKEKWPSGNRGILRKVHYVKLPLMRQVFQSELEHFICNILTFNFNFTLKTIVLSRDAKIAALEKTSQETEKLIAEARTEKIRHMDEVHAAQKRVTDLESR